MTRTLVAYLLTSVDGAVDDPRRYFPATDAERPGPPVFDAASEAYEATVIGAQDAVLLGRTMYDEWSRYWPTAQDEPFAGFINTVRKYVVTSTPLATDWDNATAVDEPVADLVARLRSEPGGDIGVHGSVSLVGALLRDGLVDQLVLGVGPVLDPDGRRAFAGVPAWTRLRLLDATPTPSGIVWLRYAVGPVAS